MLQTLLGEKTQVFWLHKILLKTCFHGYWAEEVRHASRNADSACPFLYWRDGKKGHAESAFRDACRTSSGLLGMLSEYRSAIMKFECNLGLIAISTSATRFLGHGDQTKIICIHQA